MSKNPKHTPGPWEWARCDDGDFAFLKGDGLYVLTPENIPGAAAWVDISEANAALISAAPDLLAALKLAAKWITLGEAADVARAQVVAAIAKAEVRTNG